jgi:formylglycine-generating enzyme required for sulfatase activity
VDQVSWFDVVDFCNKLSEKESLKPYYLRVGNEVGVLGGNGYRMPTEAEREWACRAGTTTRWWFGEDETELPQHGWTELNAGGHTHPVGKLTANPFGLYDLHGNVWDWCWDWHGDWPAGFSADPTGPSAGTVRVLRGGAYAFPPSYSRSALRNRYEPYLPTRYYGFRIARTVP